MYLQLLVFLLLLLFLLLTLHSSRGPKAFLIAEELPLTATILLH